MRSTFHFIVCCGRIWLPLSSHTSQKVKHSSISNGVHTHSYILCSGDSHRSICLLYAYHNKVLLYSSRQKLMSEMRVSGGERGALGREKRKIWGGDKASFFPYSIGRKSPRGSSSFPTYYYFVFYSKYVHSVFSSTGDRISHFPQENSTRTSKCKWWELFHISRDFFRHEKHPKTINFMGEKFRSGIIL